MWLLALLAGLANAADVIVVSDARPDAPGSADEVVEELQALSSRRELEIETRFADYDVEQARQLLAEAAAEKPKVIITLGGIVGSLVSTGEVETVPVVAANPVPPRDGAEPPPDNVTIVRIQVDLEEAIADLAALTGDPPESVRFGLAPELMELAARVAPPDSLVALSLEPPARADGAGRSILVGPMGHLKAEERAQLLRAWKEAGYVLLLLSDSGLPEGVVGAYVRDPERNPVARRVALTTLDRLNGSSGIAGTVHLPRGNLVLSMPTLRALNIDPPFELLAEADLRGWEEMYELRNLDSLIEEAIQNSPDLAATRARIERDNTDVGQSRASWMPDADLGATLTQLDKQLESALQSATAVTADLTIQQLIYNDAARVNLGLQLALRRSRQAELEAAEQDLALDVASAYIALLRTRAVIDVRAADLDRVRLSLELAEQRERAGDATKIEVLRWEAELANARAALVASWTDFLAVQVQLNQVCGMPVDRNVLPEDARIGQELAERIERPGQVRALAGAAEEIAVIRSPERRQLAEALDALEQARGIARRAYVMPTLAGQFALNSNVYQSPRPELTLPGSDQPLDLVVQPSLYWTAGINASVPIFSGGALRADQRRADADVASTEAQMRLLELALRGRARIAMQQAHGASVQARFRRTSSEAALQSLQAALDAYAAGAANQTTVTEARTNAVQTQLAANDAEFETSLKIYELLRAMGAMPTPREPNAAQAVREALISALEGQ